MNVLRWLAEAFSMYSRIPMPHFSWKEEDTAVSFAFMPFVGIVIGGLIFLINVPFRLPAGPRMLPIAVRVALSLLIPLAVTGGFHIDGFMDTEDALRSYASREKRLEILKDPHIGAFAVIGLVRVLLLFTASVTMLLMDDGTDLRILGILGTVFVTGRCLACLTSLVMKKAKNYGMLYEETKGQRKGVLLFLAVQLAVSVLFMLFLDPLRGGLVCLAFLLYTAFYYRQMEGVFGGVTGDTAGHYLTEAEASAIAVLALSALLPV